MSRPTRVMLALAMTDSDTERLLRMELLEMSRALAAVVASVGGEVVLHDDLLVRMSPVDGGGVTPCCGVTPFELPKWDRITLDPSLVTCGPAA